MARRLRRASPATGSGAGARSGAIPSRPASGPVIGESDAIVPPSDSDFKAIEDGKPATSATFLWCVVQASAAPGISHSDALGGRHHPRAVGAQSFSTSASGNPHE
jgi:hypothetical protein